MDKSDDGLGLPLSEILDCARKCFSSVHNRGSARTGRRPRKFEGKRSKYPPLVAERALRAARANPVFHTDEKRIRMENGVMQLPRNNCHVRVNDCVILVAANGRAMT